MKTHKMEISIIMLFFLVLVGYAVLVGAQGEDGLAPIDDNMGVDMENVDGVAEVSDQNVDMIASQLQSLEKMSFDEKVARKLFTREDYQSLVKFDYGIMPPKLGRPNPFLPVKDN